MTTLILTSTVTELILESAGQKTTLGIPIQQNPNTREYPNSATNPTSPTPVDGDRYYNTALNMPMRYDGSRSKWLSVESSVIHFGKTGNVAAGNYFCGADNQFYSATSGRYAEFAGTVVGLTVTRSDTDAAIVEVTADGVTLSSMATSAIAVNDASLNDDFSADEVLAVRVGAGGAAMSNILGWAKVKWRV